MHSHSNRVSSSHWFANACCCAAVMSVHRVRPRTRPLPFSGWARFATQRNIGTRDTLQRSAACWNSVALVAPERNVQSAAAQGPPPTVVTAVLGMVSALDDVHAQIGELRRQKACAIDSEDYVLVRDCLRALSGRYFRCSTRAVVFRELRTPLRSGMRACRTMLCTCRSGLCACAGGGDQRSSGKA